MNRRSFLQRTMIMTGVLGCPNLLPGSVWGAEGVRSPASRITVAGIGLGIQGIANLRAMLTRPGTRVPGITFRIIARVHRQLGHSPSGYRPVGAWDRKHRPGRN